jgi:hypothetical protein
MLPETLDNEDLVALHTAFAKACAELNLDADDMSRERLAQLMVTLAKDGVTDPDVIRAHAVHRMQPPIAGLFHAI